MSFKAFIVAMVFILVWVIVASGKDTNDNDKGFNPPGKVEAPRFTCPVAGTC